MDKGFSIKAFLPEFSLFIVMALLLFINLGVFDIDPYSEFFHLESAKESLVHGRFWVPLLNGHDYVVRGPLWTWLLIISFKLAGVSLTAARVPAAILGLSALGLTYLVTLELTKSRFPALFATSLLAVSWGFFHMASLASADILVLNLYLGFLWAFLKWKDCVSRRNAPVTEINRLSLIMGIMLGVLFLTSGTTNVLLLLIIAFLYLQHTQNSLLLNRLNFKLIALPALCIPLPWLIGASIKTGQSGLTWNYLVVYPLQKILGLGMWQTLHGNWLFYGKRLLLDLLPFSIIIPAALLDQEASAASVRPGHHLQSPTLWLFGWFLLGLGLHSLSAFQEPTLMLPFMAPLAILAGCYLGQAVDSSSNKTPTHYEKILIAYILLMLTSAVLLTIVIFQVVPSNYVSGFWNLPGLSVLESFTLKDKVFPLPEAFPLWKFWLIPGPFILLIGAFTLFIMQATRKLSLTPLALTSSLLIFLLFLKAVYLPIMHRPIHQVVGQQLNGSLKANDQVLLYSFHPDIKRVLFYIDPQHRSAIHFVRNSKTIAEELEQGQGIVYGVIREKSYFNDLDYEYRNLFRVNQANWQWDATNLTEMGKLLIGRLPNFESMRSEILVFQSLPTDTMRVLREEEARSQTRSSRQRNN